MIDEMGDATVEATIIGAGVAGLCVATELVARGARVTLVDPNSGPGPHGCSWWAGGMLAPFCEGESAEEPVVRLGKEAIDWWERHAGGVKRNGSLVLALGRDQGELTRFARLTEGHEEIGADRIAELEPDLGGRFGKALFFAEEAHLDPRAALLALADSLRRKGAAFQTEAGAPSALTVDCRGLAARDALKDLRGVKGEMLVLKCQDVTLSRPVRLLHPRIPLYIVPRGDGVYMLGATMVESAERDRVTARSLLEMLSAAFALHPAFGEAEVLEIGVDARPAFPDNLPRIRRKEGGAGANELHLYANGLYRHGYLLAPAMGRMVAELALDGARPEMMDEDQA